MKNHIITFAAFAFIFGFTSCRDTPSDPPGEVDILESPQETTIEEVQEEADTTTIDSVETDTLEEEMDTLSIER
jgi:hypothetical protein